jgi:Uridine phosphorylase
MQTSMKKNSFDNAKLTHSDGRMHHLGVNENEITNCCILTSNLERTEIIANFFDKAEKTGEYREYITYKGEKNGFPISVMSVGMGCMPMAIAVEELKHVNCKNMIKVGTCSAILPEVKPGTIIIPKAAVRGEGATIEYINLQYPATADLDIMFDIMNAAEQLGEEYMLGTVRTHDAIFLESRHAHPGVEQRLEQWADLGVLAVENEVAAMFTISSLIGSHAGAVLLAVDNLTTGESIDFEKEYDLLMEKVIKIGILALQITEQRRNS